MNEWPKQSECPKFYGEPDADKNGFPDRAWEDANLTRLVPPWRMVLAWDEHALVKSILIHKKCAPSLATVLQAIWEFYGRDQTKIDAVNLDLYGGAYNFRLKRGGTTLSMHSYGCAIDLDPQHNQFGARHGAMPPGVVNAFRAEGWTWGGSWLKPDFMHFQAAAV